MTHPMHPNEDITWPILSVGLISIMQTRQQQDVTVTEKGVYQAKPKSKVGTKHTVMQIGADRYASGRSAPGTVKIQIG